MTLGSALAAARKRLQQAAIPDAGLEAEVLLRHALGLDRAAFYRRLDEPLLPATAGLYDSLLQRRLTREPTAYITGHREFYGLDLEVTPAVLIPRPETETLVEAALDLARNAHAPGFSLGSGRPLLIADVGAGSGAIAIALATALPNAELYAINESAAALKISEANARRHDVSGRIIFWQGDLLEPIPDHVDLIVANLPYILTADIATLDPEVRDYEPRAALDGGPDGLDIIRALLDQAPAHLRPGGSICLEFGDGQEFAILNLARLAFPRALGNLRRDLAGKPRCLVLTTLA